jgi:hypothetical protein
VPGAEEDAAALSARNLSRRFGDRVAFRDACCDVGCGEVFGVREPAPAA